VTAIRKHLRDFVALVVLCAIGLAVGGYILSNQRLYLPAWVPVLGTDFVDYKAEFETAKSVTPGQGQTVTVAGVQVGEIAAVDLENGRAVVTMKIRKRHADLTRDVTALLRPKTGLEDMTIDLTPGSERAGRLPEGGTIPVSQTRPDVKLDEILAMLDRDTRDYLQLLVGDGGRALGGNGRALSQTLRRLEPTSRDIARITGELSERRENVRRVMHNFRLLAEAVGDKDDELSQLIDASNSVFSSFARQDANIRATLRELPGGLRATRAAMVDVDTLAQDLGPALQSLRPAARALGPSLRQTRPFLRRTTPIIRDQLRPLARDARPTVRALRPAADELAAVTPDLRRSLNVLNYLFNTLAYNPPGNEEGYLFWASWLNHIGATVFNTQDAHGPIRRGVIITSCSSLGVLDTLQLANPVLGTLIQLSNLAKTSEVCPQSTAAPLSPTPPTATEGNP
jgi:phospholipid/cholesterol/gamma-HCH transport system substrate-binding protein